MSVTEKDMRRALGLDGFKRAVKPGYRVIKWYVVLSVRRAGIGGAPTGSVFTREYSFRTCSKLDAELKAKAEARKEGLVPVRVFDSWEVISNG